MIIFCCLWLVFEYFTLPDNIEWNPIEFIFKDNNFSQYANIDWKNMYLSSFATLLLFTSKPVLHHLKSVIWSFVGKGKSSRVKHVRCFTMYQRPYLQWVDDKDKAFDMKTTIVK